MRFLTGLALTLSMLLCARRAGAADPPSVRIVAHRGLLKHAPENTLANFRACLDLRFGFELDVQVSKDGQLVCIHDTTLDRTTNGQGKVSGFTLKQLKQFDAGGWFDDRFRGERIPTLREVFDLIAARPKSTALIAVDIKLQSMLPEIVALAEETRVLDRLLFIGRPITDVSARKTLRSASGKAHVACVAHNNDELKSAIADPQSDWVYFRYLPSAMEVDQVRKRGKQTFIAGATVAGLKPDNWEKAASAGINAILTDYPFELAETLRKATIRDATAN